MSCYTGSLTHEGTIWAIVGKRLCQKRGRGFCVHVEVCWQTDGQVPVCVCLHLAVSCLSVFLVCRLVWTVTAFRSVSCLEAWDSPCGSEENQITNFLHWDFWLWLSCLPRAHSVNLSHFQSTTETLQHRERCLSYRHDVASLCVLDRDLMEIFNRTTVAKKSGIKHRTQSLLFNMSEQVL